MHADGDVNSKAGNMKMNIKKVVLCLLTVLLSPSCVLGYSPPDRYADPFYNVNYDDYPLLHLPLIKPIQANRFAGETLWRVFLPHGPRVSVPNSQNNLVYYYAIEELEKFVVKDGVLMTYSAYVDKEADAYIQENYYHWFVLIPDKKIAEGFQTEEEFSKYIQALGIQNLNWQTPNGAFDKFKETGCLEWVPDCK
jgi:hypothetical protein